ncbi:MAG: DNA-binding response regulator [Clostridium celatum]|nr:DNA-binding response regulator [Clostridium celatum]
MQNYCKHLYDNTTDGYIQIFNIDKDKKIKVYNTKIKALCDVVEEVQEQLDFFITPNTFYKPYRQVNNIRQFRALFMDLDCGDGDKLFAAYSIFELAENGEIPRPTMIVDSGRGIHLYWRIKNAPYGALNTWQELQDFFYIKLKELGADRKSTDAARVLRLPSSINSRNGEKCRVLWQDNEEEYSMCDLRDQYLKFKHNKTISKAKKSNSKIINNLFFNSYSLHMARAEDLKTLVKLRNGYMDNCRNMALHCYAYWEGIYIRDNDELRSIVESFNNSFKTPLKQAEVNAVLRCIPKAIDKFLDYEQGIRTGLNKRVTKGMRDKGGYWYKNETLIERLEITADEQRKLKTIIGTRVKYDRKNEKRNKARRNEDGLTPKQVELKELKIKVLELKEKGLNNSEIARKLNIDRKKVSRLVNS